MYLNKTQIFQRGWSPKMIENFLGEPDDVKPLGRYAEEHRYFLPRIERIETTEDFKTAQTAYLTRRKAGKLAAKTQTEARIEKARTMIIRVERLPETEVLEKAIDHFNYRCRWRKWDDDYFISPLADEDSDPRFLERITVNYIRHELTSYDSNIFQQRGRIGGDAAVSIIRRRVFEEIACAYPYLSDECERQMLQRNLMTEIEFQNKRKPKYEQLELPFRK